MSREPYRQTASSARLTTRRRGSPSGSRVVVTLACSECTSRNYKTTKQPSAAVPQLKKFCKSCRRHTLHVESK